MVGCRPEAQNVTRDNRPPSAAKSALPLMTTLQDALSRTCDRVIPVYTLQLGYRKAIRAGIEEMLALFDEKPALARLLVVDSLTGGPQILARRAQAIEALTDAVDRGRELARAPRSVTRTTARGAVGAVLAVLHDHLYFKTRTPLLSLTGELTALVIMPYLGPAAAAREANRPARRRTHGCDDRTNPLAKHPIRLTFRTALVLRVIAEHQGRHAGLSNRQIAEAAGIGDPGQASRLLARLARHDLVVNASPRAGQEGKANSWTLTLNGARMCWAIGRATDGLSEPTADC